MYFILIHFFFLLSVSYVPFIKKFDFSFYCYQGKKGSYDTPINDSFFSKRGDRLNTMACNGSQLAIINKGVRGDNSADLLGRVNQDVLSENPDLVIIMVGTNDMLNSKKLISYPEYEKNYQSIIDSLKGKGIEILLMSPPPIDTAYVLKRHDRKVFKEDLQSKIIKAGRITRKLADKNTLHFIDLYKHFKEAGSPSRDKTSLIINESNYEIEDGVHPTSAGYSLIAHVIFNYLELNNLLNKKKKIICFGDSLTFGSFMQGAGTIEGLTYPAQLHYLINNSYDLKQLD